MSTPNDFAYFEKCIKLGYVGSPFLEVGSALVQADVPNLCEIAKKNGVKSITGVDLTAGPGVDFTADFAQPAHLFKESWRKGQFSTVAIFNVLEHTFDPIAVLKNVLDCVANDGTIIVLTPAIWPIHNYPSDYLRLLPNWYEQFADSNGLELPRNTFCWLSEFGIIPVDELRDGSVFCFPTFRNIGKRQSPVRYWSSRILSRVFNSFGRSHWGTHAAIAAVFVKKKAAIGST